MEEIITDITGFTRSSDFYGEINLILTVKSFDLQSIRKRYLQSRKNKSGKTGSVERRKPALGGLVSILLNNGKVKQREILCKMPEPRALDLNHDQFACASEQAVFVLNSTGQVQTLTDPWFSYIHTVQFHPADTEKILISSSGFDLIREYQFHSKELTFEWLAWEHGFNKAKDPETGKSVILTRHPDEANELTRRNKANILIKNPEKDHLPTAKRAAFINSVTYHPNKSSQLLATFFHDGKVYKIDTQSKLAEEVLSDLKNPHGGHIWNDRMIATSTGSGEIVIKKNDKQQRLSFKNLDGKPDFLSEMEWIQNTLSHEEFLIAIDSNRTSFVIINPEKQLYDVLPYDSNWAVQDIVAGKITIEQKNALAKLR